MGKKITADDTAFTLAQSLLGDGRLTHELDIPGWLGGDQPLPVGQMARIKGERLGPPAQQITRAKNK